MYGGHTGLSVIDNLRDKILLKVSPEEIFEYYLGECVDTKKKFCSPLRHDKHPTCTFTYRNNKLLFRDWAESVPYDCFEVVKQLYQCDYRTALNIIANDFGVTSSVITKPDVNNLNRIRKPKGNRETEGSRIRIKRNNEFQPSDIQYLNSFGISIRTAKFFRVYSCYKTWINNKVIYQYSDNNPALLYHFGGYNYKIYFYKSSSSRFLCNTNRIQGYAQLPSHGEYCIITKSLKDVMVLYEAGIPAIAPQSENVLLDKGTVEELKSRFTNVYTLFDFDRAGITGANKYRKAFNIQPFFLTNGRFSTHDYQAKDVAEFTSMFGIESLKQLIYESQ